MGEILGDGRSREAYDRFSRELKDAIKLRDWIYDPSFALSQDPLIYEKIMRDPVAAHAIRFRKHLVAGQRVRVVPGGDAPEDEALAQVFEDLIGAIDGFTDARLRLSEAIFRGSAWAFIDGERVLSRPGGYAGAWWTPRRLVDVDRRRVRLTNSEGRRVSEIYSIDEGRWKPLDRSWFVCSVFDETEASLGYGNGLLNTLYVFQAEKALVIREMSRACIRFGSGLIKAKINNLRQNGETPGRTSAETVAAWKDELQRLAAENCLVHDARDEVDMLTGIGEGKELLRDAISYYDHAQVVAILGASVQTMESGGGSYALAKEHANSTEALVQADRYRLGEDLTRDLIGALARSNRRQIADAGLSGAKLPTLELAQQKREDPTASAQIIVAALGAGIRLRADEVYQALGFSEPGEDDAVIEPQTLEPGGPASLAEQLGFGRTA